MADTRVLQILITAKNEAEAQLKNFQDSIKNSAEASRSFAIGLGVAGVAVGGLGSLILSAAGDAEQTRIAFTTMLGSAEKSAVFIKDLVNFAKATPFELKGLEESSKKLLAFGFAQKDILPNLEALGNIASGVGRDKLPNLILAFGQVKAASHLTGMELRQFTEAGVPLLEELSKVTGMAVEDMAGNIGDLKIPFEQVRQALFNLSGENGRFHDLMKSQSQSFGGMVSNLKDSWDIFLRTSGQPLIEWGKQFVLMATNFVQNILPQWVARVQELTQWLSQHQVVIVIVSAAIIGALIPAVLSAAAAFLAASIALAPFIIGGAIIGGIVAGIVWIVQNWEMIKSKAIEIWNSIAAFFTTIWDGITTVFRFAISLITGLVILAFSSMGIDIVKIFSDIQTGLSIVWSVIKSIVSTSLEFIKALFKSAAKPVTEAWSSLWSIIGSNVTSAFETIKSVISGSINWIIEKINILIRAANSVAKLGAGALGLSNVLKIPEIPMLANGGIVTRPTLAVIGEAGPEAVVPLNRGNSGFGQINVTITGNSIMNGFDMQRMVEEGIMSALRLNTKLSL